MPGRQHVNDDMADAMLMYTTVTVLPAGGTPWGHRRVHVTISGGGALSIG